MVRYSEVPGRIDAAIVLTCKGHPIQQYKRNKIRTAKYTPISFIPKNLWFQFHNIANIYFLAVIILDVCIPLTIR